MRRLRIILQSNKFYLFLLTFVLLYSLLITKVIKYESKFNLTDTYLEGKIVDYNIDGNKLDLIVDDNEKVKVTYYIKEETEKFYLEENILVGSTIKLNGTFSKPLNNTMPNTFNYKNYLYNKGIYRLFSVNSYELDNKISFIYKIKNFIIERINSNEDLAPYFKTFILGDKRELSLDDYANFQSNGVSHLFAISGMHISLFSALLLFFFKRFGINDKKKFYFSFFFPCFLCIFNWFSGINCKSTSIYVVS